VIDCSCLIDVQLVRSSSKHRFPRAVVPRHLLPGIAEGVDADPRESATDSTKRREDKVHTSASISSLEPVIVIALFVPLVSIQSDNREVTISVYIKG
jgi:hypothetical protein